MGYEEAIGYSVGPLVRDKDGVSAAVLFAELAAWNRARGKTVLEHLDDIYRKVGLFVTEQVSLTKPGADGLAADPRRDDAVPRDAADASSPATRSMRSSTSRAARAGCRRPTSWCSSSPAAAA